MQFSKTKLKNGLRVVTVPMRGNPTVTVLVLVATGSKYEDKRVNGISHFLEHMCFKGTEKRPSAIHISQELDALGSQSNAFTSQEYTGYYAKSGAKHFKQVFDVVSDIYLNPTFPEAEMEREKGVIIEEINMYEDLPQRKVQELMMELLYGDQPAGWSILGPKENIRKMKRDDFLKYKKEHYVPESTIVVVAGGVSEKKVVAEAKKSFSKIPSRRKKPKKRVTEKQSKPQALVQYKKTDQSHFVLGFRSFKMGDKRNIPLAILSGVLGGGMSSRLFQKLREEMGVCYYVRTYNDTYTDHGFLQISAGVDNKRIFEVLKVILEECQKLKDFQVDEEELEKTKEYMIGNMKLSLESSDDLANYAGAEELLKGKIETLEKKEEKIRKIKAKDIQKVAKEVFVEGGMNLAVIGPFKEKTKFIKNLKF